MRHWLALGFAAALPIAFGCINVDLRPEHRALLQTVSIDPHVTIPEKPYISGPPMPLVMILEAQQASELGTWMAKNGIGVGEMVRTEVEAALEASGSELVPPGQGAPSMQLEVVEYGLTPQTFGFAMKPLLLVEARLTDNGGSRLWRRREMVNALDSETPVHPREEYFQDPTRMREALREAARLAAHRLVANLRGAPN